LMTLSTSTWLKSRGPSKRLAERCHLSAVHPALRWPEAKFHRAYPVGSFDADCVQWPVSQGLDHRQEPLFLRSGDLYPQAFLLSEPLQEGLAVHRWMNQAGFKPACNPLHRRSFVDPGPLYGRLGGRPPQLHALMAAVNALCRRCLIGIVWRIRFSHTFIIISS